MVSTAPPSYSHATEPRAVENRKKFREPTGYGNANIMYDRRVVRGSTYSQPIDTPVRRTSPPPPNARPAHFGWPLHRARGGLAAISGRLRPPSPRPALPPPSSFLWIPPPSGSNHVGECLPDLCAFRRG
jgi:hypothetical protein